MTRSVEELRRESERSRAELAATVDQLKERITDTAEDIRYKVSPQHVKSEVSDFIGKNAQSWFDALKQQAMEHPMQALAAGTADARPPAEVARCVPHRPLDRRALHVRTPGTNRRAGHAPGAPVA